MAAKHCNKRRAKDVMNLMMSSYEVRMANDDSCDEFYVHFEGPKDSPYQGGHWNVHVCLPEEYPYKSPSIGFCNPMYHPNVDESSGSVCLDVINQTWSPMFDLRNVFDVFLPQLLLYPNASDPLNQEAAALQLADPEAYKLRIEAYVREYAQLCNLDEEPSRSRGSTFTGRGSSTGDESHMSLASREYSSGPPSATEDEPRPTKGTPLTRGTSPQLEEPATTTTLASKELTEPTPKDAESDSESEEDDGGDEFSDIDDSDGEA